MRNNDIISINEDEIDVLILDIINCAEKVKNIFNKMEMTIDSTKSVFKVDSSADIYAYLDGLKIGFDVTVENIMNYSKDLKLAKTNMGTIDDISSRLMSRQTLEWFDKKQQFNVGSMPRQ